MVSNKFRFIWHTGFRGPIRNKDCLWRPYLLTDRDKISTLYRGPPIDGSYQVSIRMANRFQRRLEIDQSDTRTARDGNVY
jgi:hypothetical protein